MANSYFLSSTTISPEKSVMEIKQELVKIDVYGIYEQYEGKRIAAIAFEIEAMPERPVTVQIPVNVENIYNILLADAKKKRVRSITKAATESLLDQAHRTAWRMALQRIKLQVADVLAGQQEVLEVFLPYVVWHGKPLYRVLKESEFKLLGEGQR